MTPDLRIEQGLLVADARGVRVAARSDGFDVPEGERIAVLFGPRPAGVECPLAHFASPFGRDRVAVVQVADRGPILAFRFLVLARDLYQNLGDPFAVADHFPPPWDATGDLPMLEWPPEPLPPRTVQQIQAVLKEGDGPLLLGGAQLLVDGGRVSVERPTPDEAFLRGLWHLLPARDRCGLWPASFCFAPDLGFHAFVIPALPPAGLPGCCTEEQARDYPEGRYELNLQVAAEDGDQRALDAVFARRSSADTLRLGVQLLIGSLVVLLVMKLAF